MLHAYPRTPQKSSCHLAVTTKQRPLKKVAQPLLSPSHSAVCYSAELYRGEGCRHSSLLLCQLEHLVPLRLTGVLIY